VNGRTVTWLRSLATVTSGSAPYRASEPCQAPTIAAIMMIIHAAIAQVMGRIREPVDGVSATGVSSAGISVTEGL